MRFVSIAVTVAALPSAAFTQAPNNAQLLSTLSPAALGLPTGLSVGISTLGHSLSGTLAIGDIGIGPGALRLLGARPSRFEGYGIGYALPLASHVVTTGVRTIVGGDLSLGYLGTHLPKNDYIVGNATSMNAHLAIPLSLLIGAPDHLSFSPYMAPYAEVGAAPSGYWTPVACDMFSPCARFTYSDHYRTAGLGAAVGARLTMWRIGLDAAAGDVSRLRRSTASAALTLRI